MGNRDGDGHDDCIRIGHDDGDTNVLTRISVIMVSMQGAVLCQFPNRLQKLTIASSWQEMTFKSYDIRLWEK